MKHRGGCFAQIFSHDLEAQTPLVEWEIGHTTSPPKTASAWEEIQSERASKIVQPTDKSSDPAQRTWAFQFLYKSHVCVLHYFQ